MIENLLETILIIDVSNTTTKASLQKIGKEYRCVVSSEVPPTVETPNEDVTIGVRNATKKVEELTGYTLCGEKGEFLKRCRDGKKPRFRCNNK
jgi:hypothetical protein